MRQEKEEQKDRDLRIGLLLTILAFVAYYAGHVVAAYMRQN